MNHRTEQVDLLLRDERAIFEQWKELCRDLDVRGKNAHDARLVAAMKRHGVEHIVTSNDRDFRRFHGITVHLPQ